MKIFIKFDLFISSCTNPKFRKQQHTNECQYYIIIMHYNLVAVINQHRVDATTAAWMINAKAQYTKCVNATAQYTECVNATAQYTECLNATAQYTEWVNATAQYTECVNATAQISLV